MSDFITAHRNSPAAFGGNNQGGLIMSNDVKQIDDDDEGIMPGVAFFLEQVDAACRYFRYCGLTLDTNAKPGPLSWDERYEGRRSALRKADVSAYLGHVTFLHSRMAMTALADCGGKATLDEFREKAYERYIGPGSHNEPIPKVRPAPSFEDYDGPEG